MLHDLAPIHERPGGLLEAPRLTADGVVFSDVTGGGVYCDGATVVPSAAAWAESCPTATAAW